MLQIEQFMGYLDRGEVPPRPFTPDSIKCMGGYEYRDQCTSRGMWALVDLEWTKELADIIGSTKCLEVMAGFGWLAKALKQHGVDIIATDDQTWNGNRHSQGKPFDFVEKLEALDAIEKYKDAEILIMSWPPYDDDAACTIGEAWGNEKPIIYIGENRGGCNATDEFHQCFQGKSDLSIPYWDGMHDYLQIGTYEPKTIENNIRKQMKELMSIEPLDNATILAEETAEILDCSFNNKWLDDPHHIVWEIALEFFED